MTAQDVARLMLDRLGTLASTYDLGENAMDYLESIRCELRPLAWPQEQQDDMNAVIDYLEGEERHDKDDADYFEGN